MVATELFCGLDTIVVMSSGLVVPERCDLDGDALLADIVGACDAGANVEDYCAMRADGICHREVVALVRRRTDVDYCLTLRNDCLTTGTRCL